MWIPNCDPVIRWLHINYCKEKKKPDWFKFRGKNSEYLNKKFVTNDFGLFFFCLEKLPTGCTHYPMTVYDNWKEDQSRFFLVWCNLYVIFQKYIGSCVRYFFHWQSLEGVVGVWIIYLLLTATQRKRHTQLNCFQTDADDENGFSDFKVIPRVYLTC